ncbi:hypothetical protein A5659_03565 [Mycobacterium sp. 1165196.3]|nr:hypothetical protein A5659_03565 [Mycobacterium sp. 1165196.3]
MPAAIVSGRGDIGGAVILHARDRPGRRYIVWTLAEGAGDLYQSPIPDIHRYTQASAKRFDVAAKSVDFDVLDVAALDV